MTLADMVGFFKKYFDPRSTERARIAIHLHARGALELDDKVVKLLEKLDLGEVPADSRQSLDLLEQHLKEDKKTAGDKISSVITQAKEFGLKQEAQNSDTSTGVEGNSAISNAVEITDVRQYKASLLASSGARPIKEVSEYEDIDAKL